MTEVLIFVFLTSGASTHLLMNANGEQGGMGATTDEDHDSKKRGNNSSDGDIMVGTWQRQRGEPFL